MAYIEKGNKVRRVADDEKTLQHYLDLGFKITDGKGNTLKQGIPSDVNTLQSYYVQHLQEIEQLKNEIETLKAKATKSTSTKTTKSSKTKTVEE